MRVLITGASGFTGGFMVEFLKNQKNIELFCMTRNYSQNPSDKITWIPCDLCDKDKVEKIIQDIIPERIVHLAGLNSGSFRDLIETNLIGTDNLLQATNSLTNPCRTLVIGSSAEYGYSEKKSIAESANLIPVGTYGISKVAQDLLARSYFHRTGLQVAVVRPFNLIGPGQNSSFVCGQIINQVVEIENGMREFISLHEIKSCRDFLDVRDAISAYWSILDHGHYTDLCAGNVFNVGSGKSYSISQVLEIIWNILGKKFPVALSEKQDKILVPYQKCDNSLIISLTGWTPHIDLENSLNDMLVFHRSLKPENF